MGEGGLKTGLPAQLPQPQLQPCLSVQILLPPQAQADSEYPAPSNPGQLGPRDFGRAPPGTMALGCVGGPGVVWMIAVWELGESGFGGS